MREEVCVQEAVDVASRKSQVILERPASMGSNGADSGMSLMLGSIAYGGGPGRG